MNSKPLFTVIIVSYNQEKTIYESIMSVLAQDYECLELIITDDASNGFDSTDIIKFVDKHKRKNLRNSLLFTHEQNLGTVKNLNSAVPHANGYYVTMFAGDDCLYDEKTISKYVEAFDEDRERNIVTAQCYRYDSELKQFLYKQVNEDRAYKINGSEALIQFKMISETNSFAMGATAFKKEVLEKHGFFDERYRLVEDWPLFLQLTRNGEKFCFVDFLALKHRAGGVSKRQSRENNLALSSKVFCMDLLTVFENEIFPYMKDFSPDEQHERITRYMKLVASNRNILSNTIYESRFRVKTGFLLRYPRIAVRHFLKNKGK